MLEFVRPLEAPPCDVSMVMNASPGDDCETAHVASANPAKIVCQRISMEFDLVVILR